MKHLPKHPDASAAVLAALTILESFDNEHPEQTLSGLCRRLRLSKASAFRHLAALENKGYLVRDLATNRYCLGPNVLVLSKRFLDQNTLAVVARPVLAEIAADTGETAHLGVLDGHHVVYLETAESPQRVRALVNRGDRLPAHAVASGKAILAHSPPKTVESFVAEGLEQLTERTLGSSEELLDQLATVRTQGFAFVFGEWVDDVVAVAAPVFSHDNEVVAAVGISAPRARLSLEELTGLGPRMRRYADGISRGLGWRRSAAVATVDSEHG